MKIVGDKFSSPKLGSQVKRTVLLSRTGIIGETKSLDFLDGSISYFGGTIKQTFEYILIDNIGDGSIRVSFNKPGMTLTSSMDGAKTLNSGDNLYIQESIRNIDIYFIGASIVEFILMTK